MSAKGNKKKGKKAKEGGYKDYTLLTLEEVHTREMKYTSILVDLRSCLTYIDDAILEINDLSEKKILWEKWLAYLRCDGLPKPYIPPDIRTLFVKLKFFEDADVEKTVDWVLSVNERSILNQDIFRKDLTRKTLVDLIRKNFGTQYDEHVTIALMLLRKLEYYLDDYNMIKGAPQRMLLDLIDQKSEIQKKVCYFFDRLTYRILCAEDAYMNSIDPRTAEYIFAGKYFDIHIWTLRNVPILFDFMEDPTWCAELHQIKVTMHIPFANLEENLTIRALHMDFDHYSEHAKSYDQEITMPLDNLNAGIPDLHECLINEWNMQVEIQTQVRNVMLQKRLDWEEKMRQIEAASKPTPGKQEEKPNVKIPAKPTKEPPLITENTYPDIWEDFLAKEHQDYENFINVVYHPSVLKLTPDELNLKKYMVLGGVYQFYFVEKPVAVDFNSFTMTWHEIDQQLKIKKDVRADLFMQRARSVFSIAAFNRRSQSRVELAPTRNVRSTLQLHKVDQDEKLFRLTFELPAYLCIWGGEPIVCQYEDNLIGYTQVEPPPPPPVGQPSTATHSGHGHRHTTHPPHAQSSHIAQPSHAAQPAHAAHPAHATDGAHVQQLTEPLDAPQRKSDRNELEMADGARLTDPSGTLSDKRLGSVAKFSTTNIFRTSLSMVSLHSRVHRSSTLGFEDFSLQMPLSKAQIRNLERYCMPRIISSFKFPKEIKEEDNEELRNKPKGRGGMLVRKRASDELLDNYSERLFTYDHQLNPERLFPVFPHSESPDLPITYLYENNEPETFAELLHVLHAIKHAYKCKYEKTQNITKFKSKTNMRVLRAKSGFVIPDFFSDASRKPAQPDHAIAGRSSAATASFLGIQDEIDPNSDSRTNLVGRANGRHSKPHHRKTKTEKQSSLEDLENTPVSYTYAHWTSAHIFQSQYDKEKCRMTIWTDRLGTFAFAFKRYEHFPFRFWSVEPSEENPETEIKFTLETQFVKCVLFVTAAGYRGYVTEPTKKFVRNRIMYLVIEKPLTDFKELKRLFREKHLNIFSEHDARFYIENGYFSEKHLAAELHTYCCMAVHGTLIKFGFSDWNRLAKRRDIILRFGHNREPDDNMNLVRITPEEATFVEIQELCSDNLNVIKLQYTSTWRNIDFYADLHHLITSIYPAATEMRIKDPQLICAVKNLLCEIRPLSYS